MRRSTPWHRPSHALMPVMLVGAGQAAAVSPPVVADAPHRPDTSILAIRAATSVTARCMGWSDRVGALAPGRYDGLIAVRCKPLEDIACLQPLDVVVKGGLVFR